LKRASAKPLTGICPISLGGGIFFQENMRCITTVMYCKKISNKKSPAAGMLLKRT
jgi:hypothetical protein